MANEKDWIDILAALLTPTVAIFGLYIAYRQWRISNLELKHELYDRRFAIYTALLEFLATIMTDGKFNDQAFRSWRKTASQGYFLFDDALNNYFQEISDKAISFRKVNRAMGPDRTKADDLRWEELSKQDIEHLEWFDEQFKASKVKFAKFLRLDA